MITFISFKSEGVMFYLEIFSYVISFSCFSCGWLMEIIRYWNFYIYTPFFLLTGVIRFFSSALSVYMINFSPSSLYLPATHNTELWSVYISFPKL